MSHTVKVNEDVRKYYKIVDKLGATLLSESYDSLTNVLVSLKEAYGKIPGKIFLLARVYYIYH